MATCFWICFVFCMMAEFVFCKCFFRLCCDDCRDWINCQRLQYCYYFLFIIFFFSGAGSRNLEVFILLFYLFFSRKLPVSVACSYFFDFSFDGFYRESRSCYALDALMLVLFWSDCILLFSPNFVLIFACLINFWSSAVKKSPFYKKKNNFFSSKFKAII